MGRGKKKDFPLQVSPKKKERKKREKENPKREPPLIKLSTPEKRGTGGR